MSSSRSSYTSRAVILALVFCAVVISVAYPLREYVAQRGELSTLRADEVAAKKRVAQLEDRKRQYADPEHVAAEARERLHFVRPGETAYVVLTPPSPKPVTSINGPGHTTVKVTGGTWFDRLWSTVEVAAQPRQTATPAPSARPARR